jgi:GNAT superfamily N-acetyltransferase
MKLAAEYQIEIPGPDDWQEFQRLAAAEGWRVPEREPAWYQQYGPGSAFVLRLEENVIGLVSVMPYATSGWIGNLIVDRRYRGQGFGRRLFLQALDSLRWQGLSRAWLTASEQGQPLYHSCGFRTIASVTRLVGHGRGDRTVAHCPKPDDELWRQLLELDRRVWGEERSRYLNRLRECSSIHRTESSLLMLQRHDGFWQIGPWYATDDLADNLLPLVQQTLDQVPAGVEVVVDVPGSEWVHDLLQAAGFESRGENGLMVAGGEGQLNRRRLLALASLGSAG